MSDTDFIREVTAIVERLGHPPGDDPDLYPMSVALAALPDVDATRALDLRYYEYRVRIGIDADLRDEAELLQRLRELEIAAAPEPVAVLPTAEGYVTILRYWACPGERLLPVAKTQGPFREEAVARLRRDLHVLGEQGLVHPYAARGFSHWYVAERTGTLVLDSWEVLRKADARALANQQEDLDELLARRA